MKRYPWQFMAALGLVLFCGIAPAQALFPMKALPLDTTPQEIAKSRELIKSERAAEDARFSAEQASCYQRFAVNNCLAESRSRHRQVQGALRQQEIQVNDLERRQRGAEQKRQNDEKNSATARQEALDRQQEAQKDYQERMERAAQKQDDKERADRDRAAQNDYADRQERAAQKKPDQARANGERQPPDSKSSDLGMMPDAAEQSENRRQFEEKQRLARERQSQRDKDLAEKMKKPPVAPLPARAP